MSSIAVIKRRGIRRVGYVAPVGEMRNTCRILVGEPQAKMSVGRELKAKKHVKLSLCLTI
jgi:hypothetical protein